MKKAFKLVLLIFWLGLIFYMSSQDSGESSSTSNGLLSKIYVLYQVFGKLSLNDFLNTYSHFIRKLAHFTEFGVLGSLFYWNFSNKFNKPILICTLFTAIYAMSDEIHQSFVPGRACTIVDMLIDTMGGLCFILVFHFIYINVQKYFNSNASNNKRM